MKIEVNEKAVVAKTEYPCLMSGNGVLVLFCGEGFGTVVSENGLGQFLSFPMSAFKPFTGSVTLSND